jgi:hypothetical protein
MKGLSFVYRCTVPRIAVASLLLIAASTTACSGPRLSHDEVRKQIAAMGKSSLLPDSIQIQRIVSQSDTAAIAETTVSLAFEFKRDKDSGPWTIASVRLGDRDWIDVNELLAAINENRRRTTLESLQKLAAGIAAYRQGTGNAPNANEIVGLTNLLHPLYMSDLIRLDAWGRPIQFEISGSSYRLISYGADGVRGTPDDIVVAP